MMFLKALVNSVVISSSEKKSFCIILTWNSKKTKIHLLEIMKVPFNKVICINPVKILSNCYNMISLKIYVGMHNFWVLILGKGTAQKGWNNGMETYHSLQVDSLLLTYWFHVLKKKKKIQPFQPTPVPKIFGTLIKHWIQKKKIEHFFTITSLSESRFISSLWECVRN